MKAVIIKEKGKAELVDIEEQVLRDDYTRIRTAAVAILPKYIQRLREKSKPANLVVTNFHHTAGVGAVGGILGMLNRKDFENNASLTS